MSPIRCPICRLETEPIVQVETLAVCGGCGASLHLDGDTVRRATAAETTALGPAALQTLRQARSRIAKPERAR